MCNIVSASLCHVTSVMLQLCPYRHNDIARTTTIICKKWQARDCLDVNCFMLHPGGLGEFVCLHVFCVHHLLSFLSSGVKRLSGSDDDDDDDEVCHVLTSQGMNVT